jgi:glycosyltransferase involved in cell wall biosynthesis
MRGLRTWVDANREGEMLADHPGDVGLELAKTVRFMRPMPRPLWSQRIPNPANPTDLLATVIINNYNYGRFLEAAIESALNQTYTNTEVVVVDDGSTDDSRQIVAAYGSRVRAVFKANGGQASAFNAGFAASSGDVICMLDSDDFFHANKVERTVKAFLEDPRIHWVFHPVCRAFEDGRRQIVPVVSETIYADVRGHALRGKLPIQGPVTSGIVLSRPLIDCILPMTESIQITPDNYIIFLAMALAPGVYLAETLAVQRMHGSNSYTMRRDRILMQARVHLLIAQHMRRSFPQFSVLSNRIFSKGLGDYAKALRRDSICEATIKNYLQNSTITELPDLFLRAAYHSVRRAFAKSDG